MIKGFPCKVTEVSTAKPGKHGSAKVILKGRDIFTAKVYECTYHSGDMVDAPIVARNEYTLLNIDDETLELLDSHGEMKCDVNLPVKEHLLDVKKRNHCHFRRRKEGMPCHYPRSFGPRASYWSQIRTRCLNNNDEFAGEALNWGLKKTFDGTDLFGEFLMMFKLLNILVSSAWL